MCLDDGILVLGRGLQDFHRRFKRWFTGHVRWDRQQRDEHGDAETDTLQFFAVPPQCPRKQSQNEESADNGNVIEGQMPMSRVHGASLIYAPPRAANPAARLVSLAV